MEFETIVDASLLELIPEANLEPAHNKSVLSFANDFEDGRWRYSKFHEFIWDNIAETALSKRERDSLAHKPKSMLAAAARNLRLSDAERDVGKGSEMAEILLYGIMKKHFSALPVVPKIFYKQNRQDYAKGADSVHIVLEGSSDFSIWFGEAKFYSNLEDSRLDDVILSILNSLDTAKLRKENAIITNVSDLDEFDIGDARRTEIKNALSNSESIDHLKPRLHVPILLLHECEITEMYSEFTAEYREQMIERYKERAHTYFKRQVAKISHLVFKYSMIRFHLILVPVPRKSEVVSEFVEAAKFQRR